MVSEWSEWSECNKSCGKGHTIRTRMVKLEPQLGGSACPETIQRKKCKIRKCRSKPKEESKRRRRGKQGRHAVLEEQSGWSSKFLQTQIPESIPRHATVLSLLAKVVGCSLGPAGQTAPNPAEGASKSVSCWRRKELKALWRATARTGRRYAPVMLIPARGRYCVIQESARINVCFYGCICRKTKTIWTNVVGQTSARESCVIGGLDEVRWLERKRWGEACLRLELTELFFFCCCFFCILQHYRIIQEY